MVHSADNLISKNIDNVNKEIADSARKVARNPQEIDLLIVSKTVSTKVIRALYESGQRCFGENRAQTFRDRTRELSDLEIEWHFIGNLQKNKIKYVYHDAALVHSIDSIELLDEFGEWFRKTGKKCPCLLEVNISGEEAKHGFSQNEILAIVRQIKDREDLAVMGLMGMAPFVEDKKILRSCFRPLGQLFLATKESEGNGYRARHLSMGMSNDFPIAIEEGATLVRIGSAIFDGVEP